jgi:hypothetical protein
MRDPITKTTEDKKLPRANSNQKEFKALQKEISSIIPQVIEQAKRVGCPINRVTIRQAIKVLSFSDVNSVSIFYDRWLLYHAQNGFNGREEFNGREDAERFKSLLYILLGPSVPAEGKSPQSGPKRAQVQLDKDRERRKGKGIFVTNELLDGVAFRSLSYGPAVKLLLWCFQERHIVKRKDPYKKKGQKGYVDSGEPFSFPYDRARCLGLTHQQFSRALRELVMHGFLDVAKYGSGMLHDCSMYLLSERWKEFGTTGFKHVEMERAIPYGFRG